MHRRVPVSLWAQSLHTMNTLCHPQEPTHLLSQSLAGTMGVAQLTKLYYIINNHMLHEETAVGNGDKTEVLKNCSAAGRQIK